MVQNVASVMQDLAPEDFHLLSGVEHGMRFSEWVNREKLPQFSRLTPEEVDFRLERCLDRELVERKTIQYEGVRLRMDGYDALALRTFAERNTIEGFGVPLGVGKESDVFEVQSYRPMALKFHREGYTNFREVRRERDYTAEKEHLSWFYTARKAAEREYETLEALYPDVSVPRPEDQNRHALVMEKIDGVELSRTKLESQQVRPILEMILRELTRAYERGYVHADMSQYNVFVAEDGITIFDWPQAVSREHENAVEFLGRDVRNLFGYFERKYPGQVPDVDEFALVDAVRDGSFERLAHLE
ncbi:serine/threonine-protein kinase RIO2 [Halalkalicoccus jeotgali]|uniref:non-specific serine/threonine protein kinase n=1 Tax=Halalkalicoccus jeotgali (strain DSM 18796 / CECT 7217 / JCM 14584 / KCTC 4019 / B3) TaxID=795797 RepID=D8J7S8_HALJB|nr:serine/threonine-protein kinase RIO2 [Halalkalicoccus jeotgali]ADJ16098.1 serine/threonine protein kinase [Halalkalicoccus jeotgali B3]ELY38193.1 serine/threonine protein kinase [Halalkalicoccus jeotgali B3]